MLARFQRWTLSFALTWLVVASPAAPAFGWYDNFNDGNAEDGSPVTWQKTAATPGIYSATTGDYLLSAPGDADGEEQGADFDDNSVIASVADSFEDTYVRTGAVVLPGPNEGEVGGTLGVFARYDATTVSGYTAILSNGGHLQLLKVAGGAPALLNQINGLEINTAADAIIQLDVIGDLLNVYLWRNGQPKPVEPILSWNDSDYTSGRAGVIHNENDDNTIGVFRFATAQNTPLPDLVAGDYDYDRDVDGADFLLWQRDFGSTTNLAADGNGDLVVDGLDLDVWKTSFGTGATAVIAAVPEPSSLVLLATAALGACFRKRR
jgi:hypothetical protein